MEAGGEQTEGTDVAEQEEEEEVKINPFIIPNDFTFSTYLIETETSATVDTAEIGERLGAGNEDCVVVLRRQEVCEWFAELPAEDNPPEESAAMKALLQKDSEPTETLLALAYHYKIASLGISEVMDLEAQAARRVAQAKENEEHHLRLIEAGETPEEEPSNAEQEPIADLREKLNFIIFQSYPASLDELSTLQSLSWAPPAHKDARTISLDTVLVVNSKHPFKRAPEAGDKAAKPDPKKAKAGKGKGKEAEGTESKPPLLPQLVAELAALHSANKQTPLRDVHIHTFTLQNTWFGTALSETEDEVYERLLTNIGTLDTHRRAFSQWCIGKHGRELSIPLLADMEPPAPPPLPPTPVPVVEPTKGKPSSGKKGKEEEPPPQPPLEEKEPSEVAPPVDPAMLPCHRRYYDTLAKKMKHQTVSLPGMVSCMVEQIVRNEECRRMLNKQRDAKPANFDIEEAADGDETEQASEHKDSAVTEHDVETVQESQQKAPYEDSLLDYIDYVLDIVDGDKVIAAKKAEKGEKDRKLMEELQEENPRQLSNVLTSNNVARKLFKAGQVVEVTIGSLEGYVGSVTGHARGRIGVQFSDGKRAGVLPTHLKLVVKKEEEGVVKYGDVITLHNVGTACHVRDRDTLSLEQEALELISELLVPSFEGSNEVDTSGLPPLPASMLNSDPTTLLSEEQVSRSLVLIALEGLFHQRPLPQDTKTADENPEEEEPEEVKQKKASFANHIYEEELDRSVLLQYLCKEKYSGKDMLSGWYDEERGQGLIVNYHRYGPDRYKWVAYQNEFTGKVYFNTWLSWVKEIMEFERVPTVYVREPSEHEEEEEEEEIHEEEHEQKEAEPVAEEPAEVVSEQPVVGYEPPVDHNAEMRRRARIMRLKRFVEDGSAQHLYSENLTSISEEVTRLYPSDGAVIHVAHLTGNTDSHQTTVHLDDVLASLKVSSSTATVPDPALEPTQNLEAEPVEGDDPPEQEEKEPLAPTSAVNPISFTASFPDTTTLNVSSKVDKGQLKTFTEYCTMSGLHICLHPNGDIELTSESHIDVPLQAPFEGAVEVQEIKVNEKVIEPIPEKMGDQGKHRKETVRVFDAREGKVLSLLLKEVSRKVVGASVVRTMEDGTVSTLMPDGSVASVYHGCWLVTNGSSMSVLRHGRDAPEKVCDMLTSSNRDSESKAMITTREDLTMIVTYDLDDGATLVAHTDGTSIWTRQALVVTGVPLEGVYKAAGFHNGHPSYTSSAGSLTYTEHGWAFSDGTTADSLETCLTSVAQWFKDSAMQHDLKLSLTKQCRIERDSFPSIEVCEGPSKKQIYTNDRTIIQWNGADGMVELHKADYNAIKVSLTSQVVTFHPASLQEGTRESESEGVYYFNMLTGATRVCDSDFTTYEVSSRGRSRVTPYDAMGENHPDTEAEKVMTMDPPVCRVFYNLAGGTVTEFSEEAPDTITIVPKQHRDGLVEGGLKEAHVTHPPTLYLVDLRKGTAKRYLSPEDVVRHFRLISDDKECSEITSHAVPGDDGTEEVLLTQMYTTEPDMRLTEKLIPRIVLETQDRAKKSRLGIPSQGRVSLFNQVTTDLAPVKDVRESVTVKRRLLKGTEVGEMELLLLKHNIKKLRDDSKTREEHTGLLRVVDEQTPDEARDEEEVCAKLQEVITRREEEHRRTVNLHSKHKEEEQRLRGEELSFWHTEEGLEAAAKCLTENEKYKQAEKVLVPQPPPAEDKQDASPHSTAVVREHTPEPPPRDYHLDLSKLEPIVQAGPHKKSLDAAKTLLKQKKPSNTVRSVFEALCILLGEIPTWEKALHLSTTSNFYSRILHVAENRDRMPDTMLPALLSYIPLLQPERIADSMWELAALSNWVLSCIMYLKVLKDAGGPEELGRGTADEESTAMVTRAPEKGAIRDIYGNVRNEDMMIKSLRKGGAYSDPNSGYLSREQGVARRVKVCGNKDQHKRVIKDTLRGTKVVLDPLDASCQTRAVVTPAALHLGHLYEGNKYTADLTFTNTGQLAVRFMVKRMQSTVHPGIDKVIQIIYKQGLVAPGMSCRLQVVLNIDRQLPDINECIVVKSEASIFQVPITATIRPGSENGSNKLSPGVRNLGTLRLPGIV